jgi:DNA polymerase-1
VFKKEEISSEQVLSFFREYEFFSLAWEEEKKLKHWDDLWLKVQIVWDEQWLWELAEMIQQFDKIVLDTETTSLNIIQAELVWVSVYLDDKNIFYINRMHRWPSVDDILLKNFLKNVLAMDITIIGHNIKYDLQIIELFLDSEPRTSHASWNQQMSLGI